MSEDMPPSDQPQKLRWSRYNSAFILAPVGVTLRDRAKASLGAIGGIALTGLLCGILLGSGVTHPLLVAPMGASAVLLFAVPASPLAQPWSIVGGNVVSALAGITAAHLIPNPTMAAATAVGMAIAVMSLCKCLHPPGGAVALTAVLGGPSVAAAGYMFAIVPVGVNSALLLAAGLLYHRFSGHSYPHAAPVPAPNTHTTADPPTQMRAGVGRADIEAAVSQFGDMLDISVDDLQAVLHEAEAHAAERRHGTLRCDDIMSRDLVTIDGGAGIDQARALMIDHALQSLPVLDRTGQVEGVLTHLDLVREGSCARDVAARPYTAHADTPVMRLFQPLSDGQRHEVLVIDNERRLQGIITQTDLIAAIVASGGKVRARLPSDDAGSDAGVIPEPGGHSDMPSLTSATSSSDPIAADRRNP